MLQSLSQLELLDYVEGMNDCRIFTYQTSVSSVIGIYQVWSKMK